MCLVQRVKPGAEELAVNPAASVDGQPAVVAAAQTAPGGGRVLVLTIDSTWIWSRLPRLFRPGRRAVQPILVSNDPLAGRPRPRRQPATPDRVTDRPNYDLGQRVKFRRLQSRADVDVSQAAPSLEIIGADGKALPPDRRLRRRPAPASRTSSRPSSRPSPAAAIR